MVRKFGAVLAALLLGLSCGPGWLGIGYAAKLPGVISYQGAQDAGATLASYPSTVSGTTSAGVIRTIRVTDDGEIAIGPSTALGSTAAAGDDTANPTTGSLRTFPHWFDGTTWDRARGNAAGGLFVQGPIADAGSTAGINPVLVGVNQGGSMQMWDSDGASSDALGTGGVYPQTQAILRAFNGSAVFDRVRTVAGAANTTGTGLLASGPMLYDGTNYSQARANTNVSILASAARTTAQAVTFTNHNGRGVHVVLDVTAITDTPSLTLTIEGQDAVSGKYYTILTGTAVSTVSTNVYKVYPGIAAAANAAASDIVPRNGRISVAVADADSATYSIGLATVN